MAERPTYKLRFLDPKKRFPSMPEQPAGRSYGVVWKVFGEDPKESCYVVEFVGKTHISLLGYVSVSGKVYKVDRPVREVPLPEDPDMELVLHESDSSIGEIMVREANGAMRACARTAGSPEGPMREQSDHETWNSTRALPYGEFMASMFLRYVIFANSESALANTTGVDGLDVDMQNVVDKIKLVKLPEPVEVFLGFDTAPLPDAIETLLYRVDHAENPSGIERYAAALMSEIDLPRLRTIAATLGADMPFCLTGGLAYGTGFGERITDIAPGSRDELALIEQGFSGEVLVGAYQSQLSTPEVYHTFDIVGAAEGDRNHLQAAAISLHPRSGQVLVDGEDIVNYEPADLADKIGYVFQNPDLQILEDTVFDEVAYGPRAKKLTAETIKKQVEAALAATGLAELAGAYPRLLSFGQKRRLGVASALALNPRTLILDEITNGQDAIEKERMMQYLQTLNEEKGITIVLISHDMDVVRRYAKRAIVLKDGDLVYDGTPTELFGGAYAVEEWGLRRPTAAALAGSLGFTAATPEEFCRLLVRKGAED